LALDFAERLATDHASIDDAVMHALRAFGVAPMGPKSHAVLADGAGAAAGKDI
jgi:hypothetical protein